MAKEKVKKVNDDVEETEVVEEEEIEEDFLESNKKVKVKKEKGEKSLFSRIMNVVLWIILFCWMGVVLLDYYNVTQEKDPVFCLSRKTTKYDDGTVESCTGLGYKVYQYNRKSFKAIEFGPFWTKDKSAENDKEE